MYREGKEMLIFYTAAAILFIIGTIEGISLAIMGGKTKMVTGTIVDIRFTSAETMKVYNSKWALISYFINGEEYVSENRISVPMSFEVGDQVQVRYVINKPQKLYSRSTKRYIILLLLSFLFTIIGSYASTKY